AKSRYSHSDTLIIGRNQNARYRLRHGSSLKYMLNNWFTSKVEKGLARQARRSVTGRDDCNSLWWISLHGVSDYPIPVFLSRHEAAAIASILPFFELIQSIFQDLAKLVIATL